MGQAVNRESEKPPSKMFSETNQKEAAEYIYKLLGSIQQISTQKDLPILARLVGLARDEAKRNF
jgi:hypothetical protein